jgi:hypothetical protein
MHLTVVEEASTAALAQFLREKEYAVLRSGSTELGASPLGSIEVRSAIPHDATDLKEWLTEIPRGWRYDSR